MAKLPEYITKYIKIIQLPSKNNLTLKFVIKKRKIPVLIFRVMQNYEGLTWRHWLLYPKICIQAMRGDLSGN
jgi:hypothetical protein